MNNKEKKYWKKNFYVHEFCVIGYFWHDFSNLKTEVPDHLGDEKRKAQRIYVECVERGANSVIAAANESVESVWVLVQYENIKELIHSLRMTSVYQKLWIIITATSASFSLSLYFFFSLKYSVNFSLCEKEKRSVIIIIVGNDDHDQWVMGKH